ncbi:Acg family FMN-binding oxidoreductase [Amycolatopsis sp. H20-H5]|uniref:Acg family FMN-binding oxidoreductase n=1 Tax=Amycolatopsis sp. H20-H5 TaxID=3046309 RepID=UPI002DB7BF2B|nr:nitroreductase [Amycolatopsis sp. H20-H5]MEC3982685.1 nitroreductase [Amycolatopsis sp. H20-H5]
MASQVVPDGWSAAETQVLADAVIRAPSVHNIQPWTVRLAGRDVQLREREDITLPHFDPHGRDRTLSCGAALANLELAVRVLGRDVTTSLYPDPSQPDLVATVTAGARRALGTVDLHRYGAISRRRSYRRPFTGVLVSEHEVAAVAQAGTTSEVGVLPVRGERDSAAVAALLVTAAQTSKRDRGYQRELALWTIRDDRSHRHGVGIIAADLTAGALPWAGLVRSATDVPRCDVLLRRLEQEGLLVFHTPGDSPADHLRAGYALQSAWLTAVDAGLVASVLTQPLHDPGIRSAMARSLGLPGYPQVLMRVGHSLGTPAPASLRRATGEVLVRP